MTSPSINDSIEGKRVGIVPAFMEAAGLTPEVKAAVQRAAQELQNQGAELVEVDLPHLDAAIAAYYVIGPARRSPTWPASTAFATAIRRRAAPTCPTRARSRAPTALAPRPSAA